MAICPFMDGKECRSDCALFDNKKNLCGLITGMEAIRSEVECVGETVYNDIAMHMSY